MAGANGGKIRFELDDEWVHRVQQQLVEWGREYEQRFPWRKKIPLWQALVAEVLLLRTRASQVAPVFEELRRRYPTANRFGRASQAEISELVAPLGLHWRAPLLYQLAQEIARLRGRVPRTEPSLRKLPGVGAYAAAATQSLHAGERAVIIDANVVRVLSRLVGRAYDGDTRRKRWLRDLAEQITPMEEHRAYNYALLDLAMIVCVPGTPRCADCPLSRLCASSRA